MLAIGKLAERCTRSRFSLIVKVLEEYDTLCKIQLEHADGFKMITLTEKYNLRKIA